MLTLYYGARNHECQVPLNAVALMSLAKIGTQ